VTNLEPSTDVLLKIYETAETIKYSDERFRSLLSTGTISIHYYPPRGQEIIPSSIAVNLERDDYVLTTYRGIHDQIAKGVPLRELFAESMGKVTGTCKGKGGPMHVTHPASGLMVTTGIVGAGLPIANGMAFASKIRNDGRVTVVNFGDGASNIGAFHEALNLASVWTLPVVFVCQNNLYGEHSSFEVTTAVANVADRSVAYRMAGVTVNGNDPVEMWGAAKTAIDRARAGEGPTLLEARTFRFFGHNFGDQDGYMPKEQKAEAIANDPVPKMRSWLMAEGHATEQELKSLEDKVHAAVEDALEFALSSDYPDVSELETDVYA
jgi:acetoin:2,6-dichlorophenolindophenol oxidoreductase subunit alpha